VTQKPFQLDKALANYLKYMDFVKTSAALTLKAYKKDLTQAFGAFERLENQRAFTETELLNLSREALNRWAPLTLASRNRKAATLKSFFGWAYQERLTDRDLALQIVCPKVPKKLPHFLSVDEALSVLRSYDLEKNEDLGSLKDKALFMLLYGGGLRVSEACQLRWKDVQFTGRTVRLLGKGQKERLIVLPAMPLKVLRRLHEFAEGDFVFGETALNPRVAYNWVRNRGAKALLMKPLHPHALRHSFATHLLSSGANLRTLQEMLGHESLQATEKYTHLGVDQLARTLEAHHPLSGALGKRKSESGS
jgi:integrase/recombinase XerC/integrase/recombinase XerD